MIVAKDVRAKCDTCDTELVIWHAEPPQPIPGIVYLHSHVREHGWKVGRYGLLMCPTCQDRVRLARQDRAQARARERK